MTLDALKPEDRAACERAIRREIPEWRPIVHGRQDPGIHRPHFVRHREEPTPEHRMRLRTEQPTAEEQ